MKKMSKYIYAGVVIFVFIIIIILIIILLHQNSKLKKQNAVLTENLSSKIIEINDTKNILSALQGNFTNVKNEKNKLNENLSSELSRMTSLKAKVKNITGTVGNLEKLSRTDRELLQKYSKVYFLSENYVPSKLTQIDSRYLYDKNVDKWVHARVWPYLKMMIQSASSTGVTLLIKSAYRSFETQVKLKDRYSITYGSGANKFSADQGYSEHQLGTAIDFTTPKTGYNFSEFKNTDAYKWLNENAYKFGFILSYPKKNSYYIYEPWHWRFVGVKLATLLHNKGIYFYELSQREIDKYLVNVFD